MLSGGVDAPQSDPMQADEPLLEVRLRLETLRHLDPNRDDMFFSPMRNLNRFWNWFLRSTAEVGNDTKVSAGLWSELCHL